MAAGWSAEETEALIEIWGKAEGKTLLMVWLETKLSTKQQPRQLILWSKITPAVKQNESEKPCSVVQEGKEDICSCKQVLYMLKNNIIL